MCNNFCACTYEWDIDIAFDSDGDGVTDNDADLTGIRPVITQGAYQAIADYEVKLTAYDAANNSDSDKMTIQVRQGYDFEPPVAEAGADQKVLVDEPVNFDGSESDDNFGIASYTWDVDINVDSNGDGVKDNDIDLIGRQPVFELGYPATGIYTVKLAVNDAAGNGLSYDIMQIICYTEESSAVNICPKPFSFWPFFNFTSFPLNTRSHRGQVQLTWSSGQNANGFDIFRSSLASDVGFELIAEDYKTDYGTYLDRNVVNGVTYHYLVVGQDVCSEVATITPQTGRPGRR